MTITDKQLIRLLRKVAMILLKSGSSEHQILIMAADRLEALVSDSDTKGEISNGRA